MFQYVLVTLLAGMHIFQIHTAENESYSAVSGDPDYAFSVVVGVNPEPHPYFTPKFIADTHDVYGADICKVSHDGSQLVALFNESFQSFFKKQLSLIQAHSTLKVLYASFYVRDLPTAGYYCFQHLDYMHKMNWLFPYVNVWVPEYYFLSANETNINVTNPPQNPGTSGSTYETLK